MKTRTVILLTFIGVILFVTAMISSYSVFHHHFYPNTTSIVSAILSLAILGGVLRHLFKKLPQIEADTLENPVPLDIQELEDIALTKQLNNITKAHHIDGNL